MARKPNVFPSYLRHKQSGQARVRIDGKGYLLGEYGSEASRIAYGELIAKLGGGIGIDPFNRGSLPRNESGLTVNELVLAFMRHADGHYIKGGKPTSEIHCLKAATRPLVELYGFTAVDEFGPLMLKAIRQKMVESGWVQESCNKGFNRIRLVFKWGVENELVAPATLQKLQAVAALLKGRTQSHDNAPKTAVDDNRIETVKKLVRPLVCDLIELQRLTGSRSGELLKLTTSMQCPQCGVVVEKVPWASGKNHQTNTYRVFLARWAKRLSWQEVARVFGTNWDSVYRAVRWVVEWGIAHQDLTNITSIGIDEIQYRRGHTYLTLWIGFTS